MKEESRKIKLNVGDVSLKKELGGYYIDMRPAEIHYIENIYNGGFDEEGVPYCGLGDKQEYFSVNIAQYGFILHAHYLEQPNPETKLKLTNNVKKLIALAEINEEHCVWWHLFREEKYGIEAPWASAMAQGECISLLLRYYQLTKEEQYLNLAQKAYNFLSVLVSDRGVRQYDEKGDLWFEEYPSNPPSFVLNGFVYTLFGLIDLYRVTEDVNVKRDIDACLQTLENNLENFDAGYWSYYDLQKKELVRYYYQLNVHVPQMEVLFQLTQNPIFEKYKNKWLKQVRPLNFLFVRLMYRVLPRWRTKKFKL